MPLLLLVDGSSYLYRAFHALPDLRNKAGEPTGAIYGVLNMLRRLESDYKADYKAVVFDPKGKTFRDDWYPEYKAHRPPMPDDLRAQIEPINAAIRAAGWPVLTIDGVEADDVIGTLATQAAAADIETLISTGDKDLTQLVSPKIRWFNTMSNELLDEAGVEAKFGVPPKRIVDYLALVGDTVDGVPGVQKCGPKTAVKWLTQFGSLDNIVANAADIGGVVGQNLRDHLGFLPLGKKLVTVVCDLPDLPAPATLTATPPDTAMLRELYTRYQFRTWLTEIDGPGAAAGLPAQTVGIADTPPPAEKIAVHYDTVLTWAQFDAWLAKIEVAPLTALDTETNSLDSFEARIVGISLSVKPGEAFIAFLLVSGGVLGGVVTGKVAGFGIALGGVMLAGLLVLVLSIPVIMATWYAPVLVLFHDMKPLDAMKASFTAGARNWLPMCIFGVFLVVALFFAMLPVGMGLLLLLPVFSGAVYASYRDIFMGS